MPFPWTLSPKLNFIKLFLFGWFCVFIYLFLPWVSADSFCNAIYQDLIISPPTVIQIIFNQLRFSCWMISFVTGDLQEISYVEEPSLHYMKIASKYQQTEKMQLRVFTSQLLWSWLPSSFKSIWKEITADSSFIASWHHWDCFTVILNRAEAIWMV